MRVTASVRGGTCQSGWPCGWDATAAALKSKSRMHSCDAAAPSPNRDWGSFLGRRRYRRPPNPEEAALTFTLMDAAPFAVRAVCGVLALDAEGRLLLVRRADDGSWGRPEAVSSRVSLGATLRVESAERRPGGWSASMGCSVRTANRAARCTSTRTVVGSTSSGWCSQRRSLSRSAAQTMRSWPLASSRPKTCQSPYSVRTVRFCWTSCRRGLRRSSHKCRYRAPGAAPASAPLPSAPVEDPVSGHGVELG